MISKIKKSKNNNQQVQDLKVYLTSSSSAVVVVSTEKELFKPVKEIEKKVFGLIKIKFQTSFRGV